MSSSDVRRRKYGQISLDSNEICVASLPHTPGPENNIEEE